MSGEERRNQRRAEYREGEKSEEEVEEEEVGEGGRMWTSLEAVWEGDDSTGIHTSCSPSCNLHALKPPCEACCDYLEHVLSLLHDDILTCQHELDETGASRSSTLERRSQDAVCVGDVRRAVEEVRRGARESSLVCRKLREENQVLQSIVMMEKTAREEALEDFVRAHEELAR
eukprot:299509-Hanusia_phi.AAC.1